MDLPQLDANQTTIHVLSLGAGVQSSTLYLMSCAGEIKPIFDAAIFADTGAERPETYKYLEYLLKLSQAGGPPIIHLTTDNLGAHMRAAQTRGIGIPAPMYTEHVNGKQGMLPRQCTKDYKVLPIRRTVRRLLNHKTRSRRAWVSLGISIDEAHRAKESRVKFIINKFPLLDRQMNRTDCEQWCGDHHHPIPPRSACYFCPFQSDRQWAALRSEHPAHFLQAAVLDRELRAARPGKHLPYLWRERRPLIQINEHVDTQRPEETGFGNECEGLCGL